MLMFFCVNDKNHYNGTVYDHIDLWTLKDLQAPLYDGFSNYEVIYNHLKN